MRQLGIPTVLDRLIQQAVMQVLQGQWDVSSPGHRLRISATAVGASGGFAKAQQYMAEGRRWVVDLDLEKFFDPSTQCPLCHEITQVDRPLL